MHCPTCNRPMHMRYPGNDPENGPATVHCPREKCQRAAYEREEAAHYAELTADEAHAECLEEMEIEALYNGQVP